MPGINKAASSVLLGPDRLLITSPTKGVDMEQSISYAQCATNATASFIVSLHCIRLTLGEQELLELIVLVKHSPLRNDGPKIRDILATGHRNPSQMGGRGITI